VLWRNIKKVVQLTYAKKKKKTHGKGWASLPIDEMLKGAFHRTKSIKKKKIISRVRIFFKRGEGGHLTPLNPPPFAPALHSTLSKYTTLNTNEPTFKLLEHNDTHQITLFVFKNSLIYFF
jgi:hypothetical protein